MKLFPRLLLASFLLPGATLLNAEEAANTEDAAWNGAAELGTIFTSGNTDTRSINANVTLNYQWNAWDSTYKLSALESKEENVTSKEKYNFFAQFNRDVGERSYIAVISEQERDRFSGYLYQTAAGVNYGYRAIDTDLMELKLEFGPGYSRDKLLDTDEVVTDTVGRFALNYHWVISAGLELVEIFSIETGDEQTTYKSETGLQNQLLGNLASKITYKVKHVDTVPEGVKKTDTDFGVTLVYSF